jgi:hypothetical protein
LDWEAKGVTYLAFDYAKPALVGGLSSRVIVGESGPMHLVTDALGLDAKLVPLWRAMAAYADQQLPLPPAQHGGSGSGSESGGSAVRNGKEDVRPSVGPMSAAQAECILQEHFRNTRKV